MTEQKIVKALITEKKSGILEITLLTDQFIRTELALEKGKTPKGIFSTVIKIADSEELFAKHLEELKVS